MLQLCSRKKYGTLHDLKSGIDVFFNRGKRLDDFRLHREI